MNCTAILLLVTCLQVSAAVHAQRITLVVTDAPLEQVLKKIKAQTGYHVVYREEWMAEARRVTVNLKDVSLVDALNACFGSQPFDYSVVENTIVLKEKAPAPVKTEPPRAAFIPPPIEITGRITDADGNPLQGVSVSIKGTSNGTTTNADGKFSLSAPSKGTLVISSVGFTSQELPVSASSDLNIKLVREDQNLNAVVITALGIKKEKKALTYAVTEVSGESMTKAREINLGNALEGRVAGVNASSIATGPAGSSRVVIRGNGSLNGDNQPLYVVNGIPINNANQGTSGTYGGIDRGDGLSSINPDDIETISVLKGGTAAALYGSRAANGVILITTKSGAGSKGLGVEYSSTLTAEQAINLTDWQYQYGAGSRGAAPTSKSEAIQNGRMSWGAKLDGSSVMQPDGVARPYSPVKDNIKNFYNTGNTFTNTIAVSGGNQQANIRFSASDLSNKGILPGNTLNRKLFNLSANMTIAKQLTVEARAQYSSEVNVNRPFTSDFQKNANSGAQLIATNVDVRRLAPGYDGNGNETLWSDYIYATNPYFVINKVQNTDTKNRFLGSFTLRYAITDWLYARTRVGIDMFTFNGNNIEPTGLAYNNRGSMTQDQNTTSEVNSEALLGVDKKFGRFGLNMIAGGNRQKYKNQTLNLASGFFNVPFQYFIGNGSSQAFTPGYSASAINSLFGSADISYDGYLYLTVSGRNDWFSTLSSPTTNLKNNLFYPSVGLSYVFSDSWGSHPCWLDYGKLRASWAQVGGGAPGPYGLDLTYANQANTTQGATLQVINTNTVPSALKPYTSTTTEFGIEGRLFSNRAGFDITVYDRTTTNDIVNASIPYSTGYSAVALNVGKIRNRGIEVLLTGTPIRSDNFSWDISYNVAYNKNTVLKISDGLKVLQIIDPTTNSGATTRTLNGGIYHIVGQPFGIIYGNKALRNSAGEIVYNAATGIPIQGPATSLGKGVPPLTMGITNNFRYKSWNLGILVDGKFGGQVYSATNAYATQFGLDKRTVAGGIRENGIQESGVDQAGNKYTGNISAQTYYSTIWSTLTDQFVTDADFIKLRSVTVGYTFSPKLIAGTPFKYANLSIVGRNLLLLYNKAKNIDPESSYTNGNAQGLEDFGLPSTRSYGVNLLLRF